MDFINRIIRYGVKTNTLSSISRPTNWNKSHESETNEWWCLWY